MGLFGRKRQTLNSSRPRQQLTASGERVNAKRAEAAARINSRWQRRSFIYYDSLGEIKYAAAFYARLSKLELHVGKWIVGKDGEREFTTDPTQVDPKAVAALESVRDPGGSGSRSNLLASYGRVKFLAGEGYLFFTKDADDVDQWEFLSTSEIRPNPQGAVGGRVTYQRVKAPELGPEEYRDPGDDEWEAVQAKEAIGYRFWRRHPQYSQWPDSPMRGVLDVCEELMILDAAVRARSRSRLAGNGILWLDDRISAIPPVTDGEGPEPDEDVSNDPWLDDLTGSMLDPIADEGDASRLVPLITRVTVPLEPGLKLPDLMFHQKLVDQAEVDAERGKRLEAIQRLSIGLEMPAEVLTGMSQANHWTAWELSDDAWEHLEPFAQEFVDDLTAGYLLPTLKAAKIVDWQAYAVGYDPWRLRHEPEKAKDAKDLHRLGELSGRALRDSTGFTEADAPSDDERRVWLSVYSRDPGFALGDDPKGTGDNPLERVTESDNATGQGPAITPADGLPSSRPGSPSETDKGPPPEPTATSSLVAAHVLGACQVGLQRARILASNRVRSRAKGHPALHERLTDTSARDRHAPAVLGPEATRTLGTDAELVAGLHDVLGGALVHLLIDAAPAGVHTVPASKIDLIVAAVEQQAALSLYDENLRPLPSRVETYITGIVNASAIVNANGGGRGAHRERTRA